MRFGQTNVYGNLLEKEMEQCIMCMYGFERKESKGHFTVQYSKKNQRLVGVCGK